MHQLDKCYYEDLRRISSLCLLSLCPDELFPTLNKYFYFLSTILEYFIGIEQLVLTGKIHF